ncbi:MAG: hypothetical protein Q8934_20125 [Bacillota bacterium]|nr:hypothetical protein [Bacillota bacterium]
MKTNYKEEMIGILIEINRLLTEHLKIQKSIFNPTLRAKITIPFITKKIDFEGLYEANKKIQDELYRTIRRMHNDKKELNVDPFIYGGIKDYGLLFNASSEKLTQIAYELHQKSTKQSKITDEEYDQLINEYQMFENFRMQKGSIIQKIAGMLAQ